MRVADQRKVNIGSTKSFVSMTPMDYAVITVLLILNFHISILSPSVGNGLSLSIIIFSISRNRLNQQRKENTQKIQTTVNMSIYILY